MNPEQNTEFKKIQQLEVLGLGIELELHTEYYKPAIMEKTSLKKKRIEAVASGLCHGHSNSRSKPYL